MPHPQGGYRLQRVANDNADAYGRHLYWMVAAAAVLIPVGFLVSLFVINPVTDALLPLGVVLFWLVGFLARRQSGWRQKWNLRI